MSLTISVSFQPGKEQGKQLARVALSGTLDSGGAPQLELALARILEEPTKVVIFDLDKLTFLSSSGVRVLLAARKRLVERRGTCVMLRVAPRIEKTFEIIKALDGLTLIKDDAALDAFLTALQTPDGAPDPAAP